MTFSVFVTKQSILETFHIREDCLHSSILSLRALSPPNPHLPICRGWPWTWAVAFSLPHQFNCYVEIVSVYLKRSERVWQVKAVSFLGKVSSVVDSSRKHLFDTRYVHMVLGTLDEVGPLCLSSCLNPLRSISDAARLSGGLSWFSGDNYLASPAIHLSIIHVSIRLSVHVISQRSLSGPYAKIRTRYLKRNQIVDKLHSWDQRETKGWTVSALQCGSCVVTFMPGLLEEAQSKGCLTTVEWGGLRRSSEDGNLFWFSVVSICYTVYG